MNPQVPNWKKFWDSILANKMDSIGIPLLSNHTIMTTAKLYSDDHCQTIQWWPLPNCTVKTTVCPFSDEHHRTVQRWPLLNLTVMTTESSFYAWGRTLVNKWAALIFTLSPFLFLFTMNSRRATGLCLQGLALETCTVTPRRVFWHKTVFLSWLSHKYVEAIIEDNKYFVNRTARNRCHSLSLFCRRIRWVVYNIAIYTIWFILGVS